LVRATSRARRQGGGFALAFLDLDGFKAINDRYGHAAGDEVLMTVAKRRNRSPEQTIRCGRLGGDEFLFFARRFVHTGEGAPGRKRLRPFICKPIVLSAELGSPHVSVSASFGLAGARRTRSIRRN